MVTDEYRSDIHKLSLLKLQEKYKQKGDPSKPTIKNQASLDQLRRKYRHTPEVTTLLEKSHIDPVAVKHIKRINQYQGFYKDADGEAQTVDLMSVSYVPEQEQDTYQATPANITPSARKAPKRAYKSIFVFSDAQIGYRRINDEYYPIHDEAAMRVARLVCSDMQPDVIVNCGDTIDNAEFSRFKPDSPHFTGTMKRSLQRVHDFYAELRADNPNARIVEVDSNHNVRPRNWMLQNMPQLYDVTQAGGGEQYPIWSYPFLVNLKHVNVEWVGGYGSAEFMYSNDLVFRHGTTAVSNGSTAAKVSKQETEVNHVQGHSHRAETFHRTTRNGRYLASVIVGALCKTTGEVPSYHSAVDDLNRVVKHQEDWVQSVMEIQDYGDGNYLFNHIYIRKGVAFYNGKEYNGNE